MQNRAIGLLGGTSYPSTIIYYRRLNELYHSKVGGFHSCPLILYSIDYHDIKIRYNDPHSWDEISMLLRNHLNKLLSMNPSCLIICNNTLHKAFDLIRIELNISIPTFHILELTTQYIKRQGLKEILLLGTKFTMQDDFFKGFLRKEGIKVNLPSAQEMDEIQMIQTELASGKMREEFKFYFEQLTERFEFCDGIVLGCTELPLVFDFVETKAVIINPIELQCSNAVDFILSDG